MKNSYENKYSGISSFKDFRNEREQLVFKSKLIEAKLHLSYLSISKFFSVSYLFSSLAKEVILPKVADFIGALANKAGKDTRSGSDENKVN
jgi:hypothetical protein